MRKTLALIIITLLCPVFNCYSDNQERDKWIGSAFENIVNKNIIVRIVQGGLSFEVSSNRDFFIRSVTFNEISKENRLDEYYTFSETRKTFSLSKFQSFYYKLTPLEQKLKVLKTSTYYYFNIGSSLGTLVGYFFIVDVNNPYEVRGIEAIEEDNNYYIFNCTLYNEPVK